MTHTTVGTASVARGGSLNLIGAVCQQLALFVTTAIVARALGATALGRYSLGYAMLTVLGIVALFGFRAALTRYVAVYLADGDAERLRGVVISCIGISVAVAVVIGAGVALAAHHVATTFHDLGLVPGIFLMAAALPAITLRDASLAAIQGWRTQRAFTLIGWVYEPVARLTITVVAVALGWGLTGAFCAIVIASWTSALAAWWALLRRLRRTPRARPRFTGGEVLTFSMVSWFTTITSTGLIWADTLLLGHLSTTSSVGLYNVSTRLVTLAVFVMAPLNAAVAPHFAHLFHVGNLPELRSVYSFITGAILRLALPAFIALVVFPHGLLSVFGPGYAKGAWVTVILAFGQLVNAATGPCGTLLNMCGRVRLNMINNALTLALNVALNLFLIPRIGIVGAALAWSISLVAVNLARLVQVHVVLHAIPLNRATAKSALAALIATTVALVWRVGMGQQGVIAWFGGCLIVATTYVVATFEMKLEPRELVALAPLFRSRSRHRHRAERPVTYR